MLERNQLIAPGAQLGTVFIGHGKSPARQAMKKGPHLVGIARGVKLLLGALVVGVLEALNAVIQSVSAVLGALRGDGTCFHLT